MNSSSERCGVVVQTLSRRTENTQKREYVQKRQACTLGMIPPFCTWVPGPASGVPAAACLSQQPNLWPFRLTLRPTNTQYIHSATRVLAFAWFAFPFLAVTGMTKKGKRPSSASDGATRSGTDRSRRRSGSAAVGVGAAVKADTLRGCRVAGPPVLPLWPSDGKKKRLELDLVSKRVYQDTIFR